jgi:exopolysaccharide biosynthesis polyprenyl glycosylphosphotransferase
MAVGHVAERTSTELITLGWRPLSAVVPLTDAAALAGAVLVTGRQDRLGLFYAVTAFMILIALGSGRVRINPRLSDDVFHLLGWLSLPLVIAVMLASVDADARFGSLVAIVPLAISLVLLGRAVAYKAIRDARASGLVRESTLIIGAGQVGVRVANTLQEHPEFGLVPIGFLDLFNDAELPLPILGDAADLSLIVRQYQVRRVIVAFGSRRDPEMVTILRQCDRLPVDMYVLPRFFELGMGPEGPFTEDVRGIPLILLRRSAIRSFAWRTKRVFDLVVGSLVLLFSGPVFVASAIAVRLSGPGPIFFTQRRVGQNGKVFQMLKFRTMHENDDSDVTWSVATDHRITGVGKLLRRTGIDELPQLINVLRGEMSLVGPRPERPFFVDRFRVAVHGYEDRHRVPVGITGWAQIHGLRGDTSLEQRAVFDNYYVEHWSLWRDIVILARTALSVLRGQGG